MRLPLLRPDQTARVTAFFLVLVLGSGLELISQVLVGPREYTRIGFDLASEPPRKDGSGWSREIASPGARGVKVHFEVVRLTPGNSITIEDAAGRIVSRIESDQVDYWAPAVPGERAIIRYHLGEQLGKSADDQFIIDELHSLGKLSSSTRKDLCGTNGNQDARCFQGQTEYTKSRAVGTYEFLSDEDKDGAEEWYSCSGFLVTDGSGTNKFLTAHHCVNSQAKVDTVDVDFSWQRSSCGGIETDPPLFFDANRLLVANSDLDFSLLSLNGNPAAQVGQLTLTTASPASGMRLYMVHQPGETMNKLKKIDLSTGSNGCEVTSGPDTDGIFQHTCDTERGSSGSPVLEWTTGEVIGLHHSGLPEGSTCPEDDVNLASEMHAIYPWIQEHLPGNGSGTAPTVTRLVGMPDSEDLFGLSLSLDGDLLAVGALETDSETSTITNTGAVYLFQREGHYWIKRPAILLPPTPNLGGSFGNSVFLQGDLLLVGEYRNAEKGFNAGALHVYELDREQPRLEEGSLVYEKLLASDGSPGDQFGMTLAVAGETLVVTNHTSVLGRAAVYVFQRLGSQWMQVARMTPSDQPSQFGFSVATDGNTVAVGAPAGGPGAVYLFERSGSGWPEHETQKFVPGGISGTSSFGVSVSLSGSRLIVGNSTELPGGSVSILERMADTWIEVERLYGALPRGEFGRSVALLGESLVVGASEASVGDGSVYFYNIGSLQGPQRFVAQDGRPGDSFGFSISLSGTHLAVGAPFVDVPRMDVAETLQNAGVAYVFDLAATEIFSDGFESGDSSIWSWAVP